MESLNTLTELYKQDKTNDAVLLQLLNTLLEQFTGKILTDKGEKYLSYVPTNDLANINNASVDKETLQKSIVCLGLYYTLIYVLSTLFIGFMVQIDSVKVLPNGKEVDLPIELLDFLHSLLDRSKELCEYVINSLNSILPYLDDEYAKIYHLEKIWFFEKDIYKSKSEPLVMPSKPPKRARDMSSTN